MAADRLIDPMEAEMAHEFSTAASSGRGSPLQQASAAGLISRLLSDVTALLRNELALARSELTTAANNAKRGVTAIAAGAVVLVAGLLSLVAAAILALAQVIDPWAAALIVGVVLAVVGSLMLQTAKNEFESGALSLNRTQDGLRRDAQMIARKTS
jgi:hypothetical protein